VIDSIPLGDPYDPDDPFKKKARLHQSRYRAEVLRVPCDKYGSKLLEEDGRRLVAYYDGLGIRDVKMARYPEYSKDRDGDLLRSEHIPFNLFGPLIGRASLAKSVLRDALGLDCESVGDIEIEWAPRDKDRYLGDATAFDTIAWFENSARKRCAVGIEVKYTEGPYRMGEHEQRRVKDSSSSYWTTTRASGAFVDPEDLTLGSDAVRQFWRNHLLGLAMEQNGDVDEFHSLVVYPAGNSHCADAVPLYRSLLTEEGRERFRGVTFEDYIGALKGGDDVLRWRTFLEGRYLFGEG